MHLSVVQQCFYVIVGKWNHIKFEVKPCGLKSSDVHNLFVEGMSQLEYFLNKVLYSINDFFFNSY